MSAFNPAPLRAQFPALLQVFNGKPAIFFDNPGGTQVSQGVIEAVSRYYREQNANVGGAFETSRRTDVIVSGARQAMADLLNAPCTENIIFGPNMTSLTFHLARSFGDTIKPGDEIVITDLDHDANVSPWTDLQANGAVIRVVGINADCTVNMSEMEAALNERTRLVAISHASNAVGTIPDVQAITRMAHKVGALVFVDAVQYAPHGPIDVQALDCDFLACSAYKFFGPHVGILYGKREHLEGLRPHKVRPSKDVIPYRWETGTLNHEGLAGVAAGVEYLEHVGSEYGASFSDEYSEYPGRRLTLKWAMAAIREYEKRLSYRLLEGLSEIEGLKIYGIKDEDRLDERLPTVAFTWGKLSPRATAEYLGNRGICCWSGNYYALRLMEKLGLEAEGGAVRIGLTHYNTVEEIDVLIDALKKV
jgi:cysteine desulfurase family protein (TIGR01976 family)